VNLRILHTNFLHQWVGESKRIFNKVYHLSQRGHQVILVSPPEADINPRAKKLRIPVVEDVSFASGWNPRQDIRDFLTLRRVIQEEGIQLVHTHGSKDSWAAALATRSISSQILVLRTRHNIFKVSRHPLNRLLYRQLTDHVVAISQHIMDSFTADGFLPERRLSLIHTGVEVEQYQPGIDGSYIRAELDIPPDEPLIGTIASLIPHKGQAVLLEAAALMLQQGRPVNVLLVGGCHSTGRKPLEEQAQRLGIGSRLRLQRFRQDIPQILAALDVFVLPSLQEGLGTAAIEALAMERPVVATRVGGIPDVIQDGVTGLLVPPGDPQSLAQAILRLLDNRELAQALARAGRKHIKREFTVQGMVDKTEALYYRLLE